MTRAETLLWAMLRNRGLDGLKFRRQTPIGGYVADFFCEERKLVIELDGAPHERPAQQEHDGQRDAWLRAQGFCVLRIPNEVVLGGGDGALQAIRIAAQRQQSGR